MDEGEQSCFSGRVQQQTVLMIGRRPRDKMCIVHMSSCQWIQMPTVNTMCIDHIEHPYHDYPKSLQSQSLKVSISCTTKHENGG